MTFNMAIGGGLSGGWGAFVNDSVTSANTSVTLGALSGQLAGLQAATGGGLGQWPTLRYPTQTATAIEAQANQMAAQMNQTMTQWYYQSMAGYASANVRYMMGVDCATGADVAVCARVVETASERRARDVREAAEREKRDAAKRRAEELLFMVLDDHQKEQYLNHGYFETAVDDKTYRIKKGRSGNVFLVEKGVERYRYCAHPRDYVPDEDTMVAQLLMLKNDEGRFLQTANRTVLHSPTLGR